MAFVIVNAEGQVTRIYENTVEGAIDLATEVMAGGTFEERFAEAQKFLGVQSWSWNHERTECLN